LLINIFILVADMKQCITIAPMNYNHLKTIPSYSKKMKVTHQYIYKIIGEGKIKPVVIDGIKFIDINKNSNYLSNNFFYLISCISATNIMKTFKSILELTANFNTDLKCRKYLENQLWQDGKPVCPHCAIIDDAYRFADGRRFKCKACKKQFTVTVGTIFEGSHVELQKWFVAIYLLCSHKKGISSYQLSRDLHITQRSAWYMLHRLRYAFSTKTFLAPLQNTVELDEAFIGGKDKFRHAEKKEWKKLRCLE